MSKSILITLLIGLTLTGCEIATCDCLTQHPLVFNKIVADPPFSNLINNRAEPVMVTAIASDEDGDEIIYYWSSSAGTFDTGASAYSSTTNPARWHPPNDPGLYTLTCSVSSGGETISKSISIEVKQ